MFVTRFVTRFYPGRLADFWIAPYLPVSKEFEVGPWTLVPFDDFRRHHATTVAVYDEVRRLRTAYKVRDPHARFGAIVVPTEGRVGEEVPRSLIGRAENALAAAAFESNPKPVAEDKEASGHGMVCSENVVLFGHPLTGERSYALQTGAMSRTLALYSSEPGRPLPKIKPPNDLPEPVWFDFDSEYAGAVYRAIDGVNEAGLRVNLAIEWLRLAWENSRAITANARILSLRSGFEAILGGGSSTKTNRKLLSQQLDEPRVQRSPREWTEHGKTKSEDLSDLEYWFQMFAILRNGIAHGDLVDLGDGWTFEGHPQVNYGEEVLRRAIKRTVVQVVDEPILEEKPTTRYMMRAVEKLEADDS